MSSRKVVVALSGGVDSSVAAALLKEQGHDVTGMMLRLWSETGKEDSNRCCTPESMALARKAAAVLGIPFYVVDAKGAFHAKVVEKFLDGHSRGETPNPCLECNRQIRWTLLLEHARALGADLMATGHYARLETGGQDVVRLLRAVDRSKDQSYVLHVLNQEQLRHAVFPLGEYSKQEVRTLAELQSLPTARRHDSQDLCFLAGGDYREFIRRHRPEMLTRGKILNMQGDVVGEHHGLADYTIGQRKGLHLQSREPVYVIRKLVSENVIVVGNETALGASSLETRDFNWTAGVPLRQPFRAEVKIRYSAREQSATVTPLNDGRRVRIDFDEQQRDITRGQAAVSYIDDEVVGGGIIQ